VFPDLINKHNCVYGSNYENCMQTEGFEEDYLFKTADDCCEQWYPARKGSCPDAQTATNPEAEDEPWHSAPYPMKNYYFPDFAVNNCGYGWDYPAWYGHNGYEKSYLFANGEECCNRFFSPGGEGAPTSTRSRTITAGRRTKRTSTTCRRCRYGTIKPTTRICSATPASMGESLFVCSF